MFAVNRNPKMFDEMSDTSLHARKSLEVLGCNPRAAYCCVLFHALAVLCPSEFDGRFGSMDQVRNMGQPNMILNEILQYCVATKYLVHDVLTSILDKDRDQIYVV